MSCASQMDSLRDNNKDASPPASPRLLAAASAQQTSTRRTVATRRSKPQQYPATAVVYPGVQLTLNIGEAMKEDNVSPPLQLLTPQISPTRTEPKSNRSPTLTHSPSPPNSGRLRPHAFSTPPQRQLSTPKQQCAPQSPTPLCHQGTPQPSGIGMTPLPLGTGDRSRNGPADDGSASPSNHNRGEEHIEPVSDDVVPIGMNIPTVAQKEEECRHRRGSRGSLRRVSSLRESLAGSQSVRTASSPRSPGSSPRRGKSEKRGSAKFLSPLGA